MIHDYEDYVGLANNTAKNFPDGLHVEDSKLSDMLHAAMGLSGEAGEFMDAIKKAVIYNKSVDVENLREELGDCLWYIALGCRGLDTTLTSIMEQNIEKLKKRYPEKYTDQAAQKRADKKETGETE